MIKNIKKIGGLDKSDSQQILILTEKIDEIIVQVNWLTVMIQKRLDELNPYDSLPVRRTVGDSKKLIMGLISKTDQNFIDLIRSIIRLPDWSLAMAIRAYLGLDSLEEIKYTEDELKSFSF